MSQYELAIIGGGPAGLTAGIYASRARIETVLVEKAICGGQILITDEIENFPGFPAGTKGPELAESMEKQALKFGLTVKNNQVLSVASNPDRSYTLTLDSGQPLQVKSIIISSGARWNSLNVPGEKEFIGRGVSYCGTCDGPLCRNKDVVVVGGGDTAIEDALFLTRFASKVTVIHRRDRLRAAKILQERALKNDKMEFVFNAVPLEICGDKMVESIKVKNVLSGDIRLITCKGVFVLIGMVPNSEMVKDMVKRDDKGYIVVDSDMCTSCEGVFAAGDVTRKSLRQVVTATGDGASAAYSAQHYIDRLKGVEYK